ncbi:putative expansin-A30 [Silene latifolia]|uniref:putative expansin-A30 n=1 Tax=Silene latifolia TaxID=37657 RepID=UPI003D78535C
MGVLTRNNARNAMFVVVLPILIMILRSMVVDGYDTYTPVYEPPTWFSAHATFYGDETASETMGGACGYGNLYYNGYGTDTAALSTVIFNNGRSCGTCYQLKCVYSKWCYPNAPVIKVTATNLCPPNWYQSSDAGGWCNPPRQHFDLSKPSFMKFAEWTAGIVPVHYRRVACRPQGGLRFNLKGNPHWLLVFVMNVGGRGDVSQMWVKGCKTNWIYMTHNWGASFQAFSELEGQTLSFKIMNSAGQVVIAYNVIPQYWCSGGTYQTNVNFW